MMNEKDPLRSFKMHERKQNTFLLNVPLRSKIVFLLAFCLLLMFVISTYSLHALRKDYDYLLYQSYQSLMENCIEDFSDELEKTENYLTTVSLDETLQSVLAQFKDTGVQSSSGTYAVKQRMQQFLSSDMNESLSDFCVYTDSAGIFNSSAYNPYSHKEALTMTPEQIQTLFAQASGGKNYWITEYADAYGLLVVKEIRRVASIKLDSLGMLVGYVDLKQTVWDQIMQAQRQICYFSIADGNQKLATCSMLGDDAELEAMFPKGEDYSILSVKHTPYFTIRGQIEPYGWTYSCAISYESISSTLQSRLTSIVFTLLLCTIIMFLCSRFFVDQFLSGFKKLMWMIDKLRVGEFSEVALSKQDMERKDEIGITIRQFSVMANEIKALIQDNYERKLLEQNAKLQALEMQINPHFLYNTLEAVYCCSKMKRMEDACKIVNALGNILRQIMSTHNNETTLGQEIDLVEDYIAIQRIRFEDVLNFSMQVDHGCEAARIPKLTVMPLVENAVVHGTENCLDSCDIVLSVESDGQYIRIRVSNTGTAFCDDLLEKLRTKAIRPRHNGIGLMNIDSRLKLYFKDQYRIRFYNDGKYAVAEMVIPYEPVKEGGGDKC